MSRGGSVQTTPESSRARGYNLDIKNSHTKEEDHGDPEMLPKELTSTETEVFLVRKQLKGSLTEGLLQ